METGGIEPPAPRCDRDVFPLHHVPRDPKEYSSHAGPEYKGDHLRFPGGSSHARTGPIIGLPTECPACSARSWNTSARSVRLGRVAQGAALHGAVPDATEAGGFPSGGGGALLIKEEFPSSRYTNRTSVDPLSSWTSGQQLTAGSAGTKPYMGGRLMRKATRQGGVCVLVPQHDLSIVVETGTPHSPPPRGGLGLRGDDR